MSTDLHPQLAADTIMLGRYPLSTLLLMNDSSYPWCILVPDLEGVTEIYQLPMTDQQQLLRESSALAAAMMRAFSGDKFNIGALGNVVPQLHIHHIVRFIDDPAWPAPVWGRVPAVPYDEASLQAVVAKLRAELDGDIVWRNGISVHN